MLINYIVFTLYFADFRQLKIYFWVKDMNIYMIVTKELNFLKAHRDLSVIELLTI